MTRPTKLAAAEVSQRLTTLPGWSVKEGKLHKTFTFSDFEGKFGRKEYSDMGGCYYAQRNVVAERVLGLPRA